MPSARARRSGAPSPARGSPPAPRRGGGAPTVAADRKTSSASEGLALSQAVLATASSGRSRCTAGLLQLVARERPEPHPAGVDELRRFQVRGQPLVEPAGHPGHPAPDQRMGHLVGEERQLRGAVPEGDLVAGGDDQRSAPVDDGEPAQRGERVELRPVAEDDGPGGPRRVRIVGAGPDGLQRGAQRLQMFEGAARVGRGQVRSQQEVRGAKLAPARHRRRTGTVRASDEQQASCHEEAHRGAGDLTGRERASRDRALRERPGWRMHAGRAPSRGEFRAGWKTHRCGIVTVAGQAAG